MIWLYIALIGIGILLHVSAHKGSEKVYDPEVRAERQTAWMLPVNFIAIAFWLFGGAATVYETGRVYGAWT